MAIVKQPNIKKTALEEVMDLFGSLPNKFYLTGSRAFLASHQGSDWDYFVQFEPDLQEMLVKFGFKKVEITDYADMQIETVLYHARANVHLQIVIDAEVKAKAQEIMMAFYYCKPIPKCSETRVQWNKCIGFANEILNR